MNEDHLAVRENSANIKYLETKLNALIDILTKEGITTKDEVNSSTEDIMNKNEED